MLTKFKQAKPKNLDLLITPDLLKSWGACESGYKAALSVIGQGKTLAELLPLFDRADWLFWVLRKSGSLDKLQYVELAILSANTVLGIYERYNKKDKRPRKAIAAARAYLKDPSEKNRAAAAYAADDAYAAAYDAAAAADAYTAAYAAADAAAAAAAYTAAYAAADADAADAAAADAYDAAAADARKSHSKKLARLIALKILKWSK